VLGAALDLLGDGNGKMRQPVQIIAGAVQGVDDPYCFMLPGSAAFLAQKRMIGVVALNLPYNFCFACPVHTTHIVVACFALDRNGFHVLHLAAHDFAGRVGGFDCDIQYRMGHG